MPTAPDPAYKSRKTAPSIRGASTLKRVSRSRSLVGRVASPGGACNVRERNDPADDAHRKPAYRKRIPARPSTINRMRGWSIPLGRWMGVELRVHAFFPLLAVVCLGLSAADGVMRGLALFLLLVGAVAVRETARLLVAIYLGLKLRAVLFLPIGGLYAYATPESQEDSNQGAGQFAMALAGPARKSGHGALSGRRVSGRQRRRQAPRPAVDLVGLSGAQHGVDAGGPGPAAPCAGLPAGCRPSAAGQFARKHGLAPEGRVAAGMGQVLALAAMLGGMYLHSPWLIIAGFFIMIGAPIEEQGAFFQSVVDTVHMREVMLTDFATLSPSDTLAGALARCVHSLQEDFPVVRGPQLVGIISRQRIVDALRNDGDGYVQSAMSKAFQVARPEDTLGTTIRRISAGRGLALIPVTESGRVVGIVSVQNLMSSMSLLAEQRRMEREEAS